MVRRNGKSEVDPAELDAGHELPPADPRDDASTASAPSQAGREGRESDFDKLKAERDTLIDRLARLQAEFENARKRAVREQQEFREYALVDALKGLLPVVDSFDRAMQTSTEKSELRNGLELINKQLHDALTKLGMKAIPAKGEPF